MGKREQVEPQLLWPFKVLQEAPALVLTHPETNKAKKARNMEERQSYQYQPHTVCSWDFQWLLCRRPQ